MFQWLNAPVSSPILESPPWPAERKWLATKAATWSSPWAAAVTMDVSKVIAAAALYDGEPWDMIGHGQDNWAIPTRALPIITVPTLAATGSEMNKGAVISNDDSKVKSFVIADCLFPKVALVDPELTLTVPKDQTAYGVCDIITHVTEGYFTGVDGTPIQDRFAEAVIINAIEWGQKAVADGSDLEAASGTMGINYGP